MIESKPLNNLTIKESLEVLKEGKLINYLII